ncbi:MAG TPA: hypothetical protein VMG58_12270, partial [Candidatus Sulfotelmatobacter sp.]|nr:hypothetical protein [Candidatus Sulfotelmatobacter sp.]
RWWWGALAVTGIVLGAAYMLWLYQRTMFGEITKEENKKLQDLSPREMATLLPIIFFCFWIGLYPAPFLRSMTASVENVLHIVEKGAAGKAFGARQAVVEQPGTLALGHSGALAAAQQISQLREPATEKGLGSRDSAIDRHSALGAGVPR